MKKLTTILLTIIMLISSFSVFASGVNESAVLYLRAYIGERTTINATAEGIHVASNANNFTYSVVEQGENRTLFVVAN